MMQYLMEIVLSGLVFGLIIFLWFQNYRINALAIQLDCIEKMAQTTLNLAKNISDIQDIQADMIDGQTNVIDAQAKLLDTHWNAIENLIAIAEIRSKRS